MSPPSSPTRKVPAQMPVVPVTKIDERDVGTPDDWVPRHADLVRLTGRHPFNCEPPLPALMASGFLTAASLHYVRNHGAVPRLAWDTHTLAVGGAVAKPTTFTMDDLAALPSRELPVTLVCAGNRRKEENLLKQTIGFNWGAAGVSTAVWKGVRLCDVLEACGVAPPSEGGKHVCFVGVEDMPKGKYGTSVPYHVAMDPAQDLLLAYEMNGHPLPPDHGYPLRLVIPGYIGGRMIKWLGEIKVTDAESDNHFHFMDNRVLPEHVTAEKATAEGWWYKPDYIINQLNINSAIGSPKHEEVIAMKSSGQTVPITGYCYSGGGRKVIRVEVSIDGGKSWELSELTHPETPTDYGKYWCWCFFTISVDYMKLLMTDNAEICCRGWDASMSRQPETITWNVMGMMNNSWFRIKVHKQTGANGKPALKFQHPTLAGPGDFGGWFEQKGPCAALAKLHAAHPPILKAAPIVIDDDPNPPTLNKKAWVPLCLIEREELSHDTRRFRFGLPSDVHRLGLPVGQHLFLKATIDGQLVMRAYTPTTGDDALGYVDFVIKVYFKNVHPRFPDGGKLTQHMESLKLGDTLDFKGPMGEFSFNTGPRPDETLATFTHTKDNSKQTYDTLGFIAGGSGITPCLQVATKLLKDPKNKVTIKLLYANQTPEDILCRPQLEELAKDPRFHVWYTVDRAPDGWPYSVGFINEDMVRARLPAASPQSVVLLCGPPPMIKFACTPNLDKCGYTESHYHCF